MKIGLMRDYPKFINNLSFVAGAWFSKPLLVLKSLRFIALRISGKPAVRGMDIAITYDCNLRCPHCNVSTQHNTSRKELSDADIIKTIRQLEKEGGFYVTFTGGEVLLCLNRLEAIISAAGKRSMLYQVQTNGTLLDDNVCKKLKSIGVDNVQISFDTFHEESSWAAVLRKKESQVKLIKKHNMGVCFTWLASHNSLRGHEIKDIITFSNKHRVKIGLNFAVPQGRWKNSRKMLLTPSDSTRLRRIASGNRHLYIDLQNNMFKYGCPAFSERFHINAYGDVQPCTFFQINFGNITEQPLRGILNRGRKHPLFKGFPDHCPPAENNEYINSWFNNEFHTLPVPFTEFKYFSGYPETNHRCVVCGENVNIPFLSELSEVEYGLPWTGSLKRCAGCGLIQQVPMLNAESAVSLYPEEYIHYNPQPNGIKGFLMHIYMNRTVSLMKRLNVQKGQTLLDIGCGAGEKLSILKNRLGLDVVGVEPSKAAADKAQKLFGLTVYHGMFSPEMFEPLSFDFVRINHVIEHVPDPVGFLNDIYTVLKPGGYIIGETENINCPSFKLFGRYWALLHLPYHLVLFSKTTLENAFNKSQFNGVMTRDSGDPPAWSLSLQNYLRRNQAADQRTSSRMKGYILLTLLSTPLSWLEQFTGRGPVTEFHSMKHKPKQESHQPL